MNRKMIKKILVGAASVCTLLVVVLCIHIYIVTRPKPADPKALAMARIDFKQDITQDDADKITTWLYQQKGVDHVLCNAATNIAVFTFHPALVKADDIVSNFKTATDYKASRFVPSAEDMQKGCPAMATNTFSGKVYSFFRHI